MAQNPWLKLALAWVATLLLASAAQASALHPECASDLPTVSLPRLETQGLRIGLALGSGSVHGFAHIGVIQELEARGVDVAVVTGTSVGALFGGLWASGLSGTEIEQLAREGDWLETNRLAFSWQGLYTNDPLQKPLERAFAGKPIESWPKRFGAVATNLSNGHRQLLTSGPGALALQASSAVPGYYRPVFVGGEKLGDGALVEPVPVNAARALGADFVIAVDVAYRPYEESVGSATQYAFQAMHILVNALATQQLATADVAIRLDLHHTLMACGRDSLIPEGRLALRRAWPHIEKALAQAAERTRKR